jgi:aminoglycoside 6-adenylyltransferase
MLFKDGNRIDLHVETKEHMLGHYLKDKLTVPLLDKDDILPAIPVPTDADYWVKKPTNAEYQCCCNDFWWCLQNVGKGIWRDELPYAKQMFEVVIRERLDEMVSWWIGNQYDYTISTGKMGKYFKKYLSEQHWNLYEKTFSDGDYRNFWVSIFTACELFRNLAIELAEALSFSYPVRDDNNMFQYLRHLRALPADAKEIY